MSSLELVLYMPVLMLIILLVVQFALVYFGKMVASSVARETARIARVYDDPGRARAAGERYAADMGKGVLEDVSIDVVADGDSFRVVVTGHAQRITPFPIPRVSQTVEGPVEEYQP